MSNGKRPERPPAEQYTADLPGVGTGLLDTLRTLLDSPLAFDTLSAENRRLFGSWNPTTHTVTLNPKALEAAIARARRRDPLMGGGHEPVMTLIHEVLGHGLGLGGSRGEEAAAERLGRSFIRQSDRANLPFRNVREMQTEGRMRGLLESLP